MERLLITGGKVVDNGIVQESAVLVENGRIAGVLSPHELPAETAARRFPAHGCYVAPGYVDLLCHGGWGIDSLDGDLGALAKRMLPHGTTAFLAGLRSAPLPLIEAALERIGAGIAAGGAELLGGHIEGIYYNPEWGGAQARSTLRTPDAAEALCLAELGHGALKIMTLSPELHGALEVTEALVSKGVRVSLGHSAASAAQIDAAVVAGASLVTHLYNATGGAFYREGGVRTQDFSIASLLRDALVATIIADGVHVEPDLMRLTLKCKGSSGVALVTDAIMAAGLPDGTYPTADGQSVVIGGGTARKETGGLFGSVLTLDVAVRNVVKWGIPLPQAVEMASTVPARLLGLRKGRVVPGFDADIVLLDRDLHVMETFVAGKPLLREKL